MDTALYLSMVRANMTVAYRYSDAQLVTIGLDMCTGFGDGDTYMQIADVAITDGWSAHDTATFIGYSVAAFCPTYADQFPGQPSS
jgi:hypothetical protein